MGILKKIPINFVLLEMFKFGHKIQWHNWCVYVHIYIRTPHDRICVLCATSYVRIYYHKFYMQTLLLWHHWLFLHKIIMLVWILCTRVFDRHDSSGCVPPRPPIRPRHTLRSTGSDGGSATGDVCDGENNPRLAMSPSYVDPKELNTSISRGQSKE